MSDYGIHIQWTMSECSSNQLSWNEALHKILDQCARGYIIDSWSVRLPRVQRIDHTLHYRCIRHFGLRQRCTSSGKDLSSTIHTIRPSLYHPLHSSRNRVVRVSNGQKLRQCTVNNIVNSGSRNTSICQRYAIAGFNVRLQQ